MTTTLARRIFLAHMELTYRLGRRVPLAEFGELIAKEMGRESPFTAAAVSRWESGAQVPSADVIEAIARVTETDPGWISHGDKTAAPPPPRSGEYPRFEARRPAAQEPEAGAKRRAKEPEADAGAKSANPRAGKRKRRRGQ
jgi:transcriptional regulator with XRE-family HTH domain